MILYSKTGKKIELSTMQPGQNPVCLPVFKGEQIILNRYLGSLHAEYPRTSEGLAAAIAEFKRCRESEPCNVIHRPAEEQDKLLSDCTLDGYADSRNPRWPRKKRVGI